MWFGELPKRRRVEAERPSAELPLKPLWQILQGGVNLRLPSFYVSRSLSGRALNGCVHELWKPGRSR
jgi:hypothetical protein